MELEGYKSSLYICCLNLLAFQMLLLNCLNAIVKNHVATFHPEAFKRLHPKSDANKLDINNSKTELLPNMKSYKGKNV